MRNLERMTRAGLRQGGSAAHFGLEVLVDLIQGVSHSLMGIIERNLAQLPAGLIDVQVEVTQSFLHQRVTTLQNLRQLVHDEPETRSR